jgi:hypothetical protein
MAAVPTVAVRVVLLVTTVANCTVSMTATVEATKRLPAKFNVKVFCTSVYDTEVGSIELNTGVGRALRQTGLIALHPVKGIINPIKIIRTHETMRGAILSQSWTTATRNPRAAKSRILLHQINWAQVTGMEHVSFFSRSGA